MASWPSRHHATFSLSERPVRSHFLLLEVSGTSYSFGRYRRTIRAFSKFCISRERLSKGKETRHEKSDTRVAFSESKKPCN